MSAEKYYSLFFIINCISNYSLVLLYLFNFLFLFAEKKTNYLRENKYSN